MVEKIKNYLQSDDRDYNEGLLLLSKVSRNRILLQTLSRKQLQSKLEYELKKYLDRVAPEVKVKQKKNKKKTTGKKTTGKNPGKDLTTELPVIEDPKKTRVIAGKNAVKYEDLPEDLKKAWDQNTEAYKTSRTLHEKLKLMKEAKPADRKPLVDELSRLQQLVRKNWEKIDGWDGKEPLPDTADPINHKRINANRKYISTNLKKLSSSPGDEDLKAKIQERITELVKAGESFKDEETLKSLGFEL